MDNGRDVDEKTATWLAIMAVSCIAPPVDIVATAVSTITATEAPPK